jgi:tRNA A37 threonylcarbamoyladenosine dehydratase
MERFKRTALLLGEEAFSRLQDSFVVVCGLGAVGSYAAEALARSGVGRLRLVDFDKISPSNINRQLYALTETVGRLKCDVAEERIHGINPACKIEKKPLFIHTDTLDEILEGEPDFVIDAIDSLNPKVELIAALQERGIAFISSMGAALKTDTSCIKIGPIKKVTYCPLAAMLRKRLRRRNLSLDFPCVYSNEKVSKYALASPDTENAVLRGNIQGRERNILGSLPTITGIFGLTVSNYALKHLTAHM